MIGYSIWSVVAVIFLIIGISAWRSEKPIGFFTGVEPPEVTDVKSYNHAVAKIWFAFSVLLELTGIPLLFTKQNSAVALLMIPIVVGLIIAMVLIYFRIEAKYRK